MATDDPSKQVPIAPAAIETPAAPAAPSTPETPPSTPAPSTPESFSLQSYAAQQGYDTAGFKSEAELAAALFKAADQYTQIEPLANIGRQFAPYADKMSDFQEYLTAKEAEAAKAAEAAAQAAAPPPLEWKKAEYDPAWERYCQVNQQTGRYEPIHPDFAPYARKLNDVAEARQYNSRKVLDDLPGILDQYSTSREATLKQAILNEARALFQQELANRQVEQATNSWISEHEKDLFVHDATGRTVFGPDGNQRLTPKGEALRMHAEALREGGMSNPDQIREYAWRAVAADEAAGRFRQGAPAVPAVPVPAPAARPQRFLNRFAGNAGNGRTPSRGGGIPDDTAPQSITAAPSGDLRGIVDRLASEQGITLT
jgi:hypothetical protein